MKGDVYERNVITQDQLFARILDAAVRVDMKIKSDEQHAIFTYELQSELRVAVGFWNIYCELLQIYFNI